MKSKLNLIQFKRPPEKFSMRIQHFLRYIVKTRDIRYSICAHVTVTWTRDINNSH